MELSKADSIYLAEIQQCILTCVQFAPISLRQERKQYTNASLAQLIISAFFWAPKRGKMQFHLQKYARKLSKNNSKSYFSKLRIREKIGGSDKKLISSRRNLCGLLRSAPLR